MFLNENNKNVTLIAYTERSFQKVTNLGNARFIKLVIKDKAEYSDVDKENIRLSYS